jgi:ribosomal protein L16/L10AE
MALEAARQYLNNQLTKILADNFYLACKPYPHQVIRENKTFSGGSKGERVQSGMAHSFGTTMFRAAVVKAGEPVFVIGFPDKKHISFIRKLCKSSAGKLPCSTKIIYEEVK